MMKNILQTIALSFMALCLVFCGQATSEGTPGIQFQVTDSQGNQIDLIAPILNSTKVEQSVEIDIALDSTSIDYFSEFSIERKVGNGDFITLHQTSENEYVDGISNTSGVHTYRVRAGYMIDGELVYLDYSNETDHEFLQNLDGGESVFVGFD